MACEILVATPAVRNLIREGKTHQIYSAMQAGAKLRDDDHGPDAGPTGQDGAISQQTADERCSNPQDLKRLIEAA